MKLFLADGRFGNQIFQYAFLKTIQKENEGVIVSGFEDLKEVFEVKDITNINKKNRWLRGFLFRLLKPALIFFSDKKIISSVEVVREKVLEKFSRESCAINKNKGYLKFITFVKLGFFQSEVFFDKRVVENLIIKKIHLDSAASLLSVIPKNSHKIFIHIRRGDYKSYEVYGKGTLLPMSYYKEQIEWFIANKENPFFIFLSDDAEFIENEFNDIENKMISTNNHFGTDFALMTLCKSAILSPSSFGWWGSYFMKEKDIVFAPRYWLGFNSKKEYQSKGSPSFAQEVDI